MMQKLSKHKIIIGFLLLAWEFRTVSSDSPCLRDWEESPERDTSWASILSDTKEQLVRPFRMFGKHVVKPVRRIFNNFKDGIIQLFSKTTGDLKEVTTRPKALKAGQELQKRILVPNNTIVIIDANDNNVPVNHVVLHTKQKINGTIKPSKTTKSKLKHIKTPYNKPTQNKQKHTKPTYRHTTQAGIKYEVLLPTSGLRETPDVQNRIFVPNNSVVIIDDNNHNVKIVYRRFRNGPSTTDRPYSFSPRY